MLTYALPIDEPKSVSFTQLYSALLCFTYRRAEVCQLYFDVERVVDGVQRLGARVGEGEHLRTHTSAYVSIRQHTSAYVNIRL